MTKGLPLVVVVRPSHDFHHRRGWATLLSGLGACLLWVRTRHPEGGSRLPLYPRKADIQSFTEDVRFVPLTSDLRLDTPQQSLLRYSMRPAAAYAI
jgi:hypothetical protein